jgi:hypothetical protein
MALRLADRLAALRPLVLRLGFQIKAYPEVLASEARRVRVRKGLRH